MKAEVLNISKLSVSGEHHEKVNNINLLLREADCFVFMGLDDTRLIISNIFRGKGRIDQGKIYINKKEIQSCQRSTFEHEKVFFIDGNMAFLNSLNLSENIFLLKRNSLRKIFLNEKAIRIQTKTLFETYGLDIDVNEKIENLNKAEKIMVSIVRAAGQGARILVLNDIATECSMKDKERLHKLLEIIKMQGIALLISDNHSEDFFEIADCIIVMNHGGIEKKIYDRDQFQMGYEIIMKGIRSRIEEEYQNRKVKIRENITIPLQEALKEKLCVYHDIWLGNEPFDIEIHKGEILLIVNSEATQQKKLWNIMSGNDLLKPAITLNNRDVRYKDNLDLLHNRIVFWGYGMESNEIFPSLSVKDNIILPSVKKISSRLGMYQHGSSYIFNDGLLFKDGISNTGLEQASANDALKIILYRWKLYHPKVFILCNIISSVDVKTKEWLKKELSEMAERGTGIILMDMAMSDALKMADHTITINRGRVTGKFSRENYIDTDWEEYLRN